MTLHRLNALERGLRANPGTWHFIKDELFLELIAMAKKAARKYDHTKTKVSGAGSKG